MEDDKLNELTGQGEQQELDNIDDNNSEIETVPTELEKKEEVKKFNPDDIDLGIGTNASGYDLTKFKEVLELDNEENLANVEKFAEKFKPLGLSQEQFEGLLQMELDQRAEMLDPKKVQENLIKGMSYEERVNYKANCNVLKSALEKSGQQHLFDYLAADPIAMKVVNAVIQQIGRGQDVNSIKTRETRSNGRLLTAKQGLDFFEEFLKTSKADEKAIEEKKKEIRSKLSNQDEINYFNEILGN